MTQTKQQLLTALKSVRDKWETLLAERREQELIARSNPSDWSVSDVVVHLMAWQQLSIARLEAALAGTDPRYPEWLDGADPFFADADEHVDEFNARIRARYGDRPWTSVHAGWRHGFQRFLELAEALTEDDLADMNRFRWLNGSPLSAVLDGALEHHEHHYEAVHARLAQPQSGTAVRR